MIYLRRLAPVKKCGALALFYEKEYNSDILYEGDYDRYA